eukprot:2862655-Amphidinium_carterae.1
MPSMHSLAPVLSVKPRLVICSVKLEWDSSDQLGPIFGSFLRSFSKRRCQQSDIRTSSPKVSN